MTETEMLIEELVSDRQKFNEFVYTPLNLAVNEANARKDDQHIKNYLNVNLPFSLPEPLKKANRAVIFRQLATPNYEFRRFVSLIDGIEGFDPLVFEYHSDKFTDNNEYKYYLGMLAFYCGKGKKGGEKICLLNCIDFNSSRGKKISELKTRWGQNLVDFHHELLSSAYRQNVELFDASEWFLKSGNSALNYYEHFLSLFLQNGILFENFMLDAKELQFTKTVFLPTFINIINKTGKKPLIVALEPTEVESEVFWMCHPSETMTFVESRLNSSKTEV